jgi:hypothetical protein
MDATQKHRMWKVAACHFAISCIAFVCVLNLFHVKILYYSLSGSPVYPGWFNIAYNYSVKIIFILQPHYLALKLFHINEWFLTILIPLWSLCFAWLYLKFTNWLNHFPVLGKKVF